MAQPLGTNRRCVALVTAVVSSSSAVVVVEVE